MNVREFGTELIATKDLDPVYPMLAHAALPEDQLDRWLLAYWCFYHVGAASWLSEQQKSFFWRWMSEAAINTVAPPPKNRLGVARWRWPRSPERRHFRGEKCIDAIRTLSLTGSPSELIARLKQQTHKDVMEKVQLWPQFGPWIAFKVADMLEVIKGWPISFSSDIPLIYAEPREGLAMVAREAGQTPEATVNDLLEWVAAYREPANQQRACGIQEVETILCKYKSFRNGHYKVGKDTHEITEALIGWGDTADMLRMHVP